MPPFCAEGTYVVNIGAAWQGGSSSLDGLKKESAVVGQDYAWNLLEEARNENLRGRTECSHPTIIAWEANPVKLEGLVRVKRLKFNNSSKLILRGGLATPESIAAAPELAPPNPTLRSRPHLLKVDIDSIDLPVVAACLKRFRPHLIVVEGKAARDA